MREPGTWREWSYIGSSVGICLGKWWDILTNITGLIYSPYIIENVHKILSVGGGGNALYNLYIFFCLFLNK